MSSEQISVKIQNNTSCYQPITLFGNSFDVPSNINTPTVASRTFSYDIASEGYYFGTGVTQQVQIQVDSVPITSGTPFSCASLASQDVSGVVNSINSLGGATFNNPSGSVVEGTSPTLYYGDLRIAPKINALVTSTVSNVYNAVEVTINSDIVLSVPNNCGVNVTAISFDGLVGETMNVQFSSDAAAAAYIFAIDFYADYLSAPVSLYGVAGAGAFLVSVPIPIGLPSGGSFQITASII